MLAVGYDTLADREGEIGVVLAGVETVGLLSVGDLESSDTTREGLQVQDFRFRRLPRCQGHATEGSDDRLGIDSICLRSFEEGHAEVLDGGWVSDHHLPPFAWCRVTASSKG
jgi:hypothetical protein